MDTPSNIEVVEHKHPGAIFTIHVTVRWERFRSIQRLDTEDTRVEAWVWR